MITPYRLSNLFYGVGVENLLCHHIYCCMLKVAARGQNADHVETELEVVRIPLSV